MTERAGVDAYEEALKHLLIGWKMHTAGGVDVAPADIPVLALTYPWIAHTHRLGAAVQLLTRKGFGHECHAMVRSALEHALMAHWVAVTGETAVSSWYAEDHHLLELLLKDARGGPRDVAPTTWDLDKLAELIEVRRPIGADEAKIQTRVSQVCERLGLSNSIYAAYRLHCWFAHPTTHAAGVYLVDLGDGRFGVRDKPDDPLPAGNLTMVTHCVFGARRVFDDLTPSRRYESWLDEIADSIQLTPRLPQPG